jgi:hypothetical protein
MREHMQDLLEALDAMGRCDDAEDALRQFIGFHIRFHLQRPDEVFIAYMELRNLSPENFAEIEDLRRQYENVLESILDSGQQAGQFAISDTKIATLAVIAMLNGVMTWYRSGGRLSLDEVEEIYWNMVHKAVTA